MGDARPPWQALNASKTSFFLHIGSFLKSIDVWKCVGVWLLKHAHSRDGFLDSALLHVLVIRRSMWRPCFWPYGCVLTAVCLGHVGLAGRERYGIPHMKKMIWDDVPMEEYPFPKWGPTSWDWLACENCTLEPQVTL